MAVWNDQYKLNPQTDNNPGYGAAAIRDLKANLEGIIGREHTFDLDDVPAQGKHFPGTAILDLDSDPDAINNLTKGRLKGITGVLDDTTATLEVKGETIDLNVVGYNQVSLLGDETIAGEKTFTTAPTITQTVSDASSDTTIANVKYVKDKTVTTAIEPIIENVSPTSDYLIEDQYGKDIVTLTHKADVSNLELLLGQISSEMAELRVALNLVASNNDFNQDLRSTGSPTFNIVTATKVFGGVYS